MRKKNTNRMIKKNMMKLKKMIRIIYMNKNKFNISHQLKTSMMI